MSLGPRSPRRRHALVPALVAFLACTRPAPQGPATPATSTTAAEHVLDQPAALAGATHASPEPAPSPSSEPAATPSPAVLPAGPASMPVRLAVATGGTAELVLDPATTAVVDPRSTFRVEVSAVVADGRLSLRDDQDAMVPSAGTTELGTSWTRFQLTPDAPLVPGSSYTLLVDGSASHAPHDASGQALRPVVLHVKTAGERPPPRPKRRRAGR